MQLLNLIQGTPEWLAHRKNQDNASDAAAMMGCSPYKTRTQLLRERKTGIPAEISEYQAKLFAEGHRTEGLARPLAEKIMGEDLFPVVGTNGQGMSASFDGLTVMEDKSWEHKLLNKALREAFDNYTPLPLYFRVQMEHQMIVAETVEQVLFTASEWNGDELVDERHVWYISEPALRQAVIDGWVQFHRDLESFEVAADEVKAVAKPMQALPALRVEIRGEIVASNLQAYRDAAQEFVGAIITDLVTDQDFADAKAAVKFCDESEKKIAAAKEAALAETASIDEVLKSFDFVGELFRSKRLSLDKLVKKRETERKVEIVAKASKAYTEHLAALRKECDGMPIACAAPDFAESIKGKRSIASMQDAVGTDLAKGKIAADAAARHVRANLFTIKTAGEGYDFLFNDKAAIVGKATDDLKLLIQSRIEKYKIDEQAKKDAAEAAAKAKAEAEEKAKAEAAAKATAAVELDKTLEALPDVNPMPAAATRPAPAPAPVARTGRGSFRTSPATDYRSASRGGAEKPAELDLIDAFLAHHDSQGGPYYNDPRELLFAYETFKAEQAMTV